MCCKRRYNICTCSVILGELKSFRNYKGFRTFSPKILEANKVITKVKNFQIPLSIIFLNPKILGSLFCMENSPTWGVKCEKLDFRKS